jgi:hypothetical protein
MHLVEGLDHGVLVGGVDGRRTHALAKLEDGLDNAELGGSGIQTSDGHPVVDNHTSTDNGRTSVDGTGNERNLQQRAQLVLVLDAGLGVDNTTGVAQAHVRANKDVVGDCLSENLDTQNIGNDLLGLALQIRVDKGDVVVAANDVAESGKALFDTLDLYIIGDAVAQMLELLVGCAGGDEQTSAVTGCETTNNASTGNGGVADGDDVLEFGFEDTAPVVSFSCRRRRQRRGRTSL